MYPFKGRKYIFDRRVATKIYQLHFVLLHREGHRATAWNSGSHSHAGVNRKVLAYNVTICNEDCCCWYPSVNDSRVEIHRTSGTQRIDVQSAFETSVLISSHLHRERASFYSWILVQNFAVDLTRSRRSKASITVYLVVGRLRHRSHFFLRIINGSYIIR